MSRIAVVEDNESTMTLVRAILASHHDVIEFPSGQTAVAGVADSAPDLVLLDVSLPDIDGPDVLRALRDDARTADVKIVAFTAHAMTGDRERLIAMGFDDYISKPLIDLDAFRDQITSLAESPSG